MQYQLQHIGEEARCSALYQCPYCATEFEIDSIGFADRRAMVVTKWLNLGSCDNPANSDWQRHTSTNARAQPIAIARSSTRAIYELHAGRSQAIATARNTSLIRHERFHQSPYSLSGEWLPEYDRGSKQSRQYFKWPQLHLTRRHQRKS